MVLFDKHSLEGILAAAQYCHHLLCRGITLPYYQPHLADTSNSRLRHFHFDSPPGKDYDYPVVFAENEQNSALFRRSDTEINA